MDKGDSNSASPGPMSASRYKQLASQIAGRQKTIDEIDRKDIDPGVTQLQLIIAFDEKLKEMASIKDA